jgi:hypothetical protein
MLVAPVVVLERCGPIQALKRSNALVKGRSMRAFWIIVVCGVMTAVVNGVLRAILGSILHGFLRAWLPGAIASAIAAPFISVALTLAYFHLRSAEDDPSLEKADPLELAPVAPNSK